MEEGGTVLAGGERAGPDAYLIAATVFENVADDRTLEEAIGRGGIKSSCYGPHEQRRAAIHFYTEEINVYHDA